MEGQVMATDTVEKVGNAAGNARQAISDAADEMSRKGREAADNAGEATTQLDATLRAAIQERPYTALAIAGAVGFLYAAVRR
jgi:ElaB/YqjD/DUF883 family membrane-anchored ribosome-binding protein